MLQKIYPIFHKGKKIYFSDWTNLKTTEEAVQVMTETSDFIVNLGQKKLLEIIDTTGSYGTGETLKEVKIVNNKVKPFSGRKAMIGLSKSQKLILNTVNLFSGTNVVGFDDVEDAKEWLVK